MSVNIAFEYIEAKVTGEGFTQWVEPFDKENIASTIIDQSFHVALVSTVRENQGNQSITMRHGFEVSLFFKGYRNTKAEAHELLARAESVILSLCGYNNDWNAINSVQFQRLELLPFDETENNSILVAVISVDVILSLCFN
jgi:hypothetical protein